MCSLLTRLSRLVGKRRGSATVEFAIVVPFILLVAVAVVEIGRGLAQEQAIDKGLRAGAMLAARSDLPLDATTLQRIENLVQTGTLDGTGDFLVPGWANPQSRLTVTSITTDVGGQQVPVMRLEAEVPFDELLPGVYGFVGIDHLVLKTSHEQVYIGN